MYVRWRLYKSKALNYWHRKRNNERARLNAILVESVRVGGKAQQKHIALLASTSTPIDDNGRRHFWYRLAEKLDWLGNRISPDERKAIEATIVKKVGGRPMTAREVKQYERERERLLGSFSRNPPATEAAPGAP